MWQDRSHHLCIDWTWIWAKIVQTSFTGIFGSCSLLDNTTIRLNNMNYSHVFEQNLNFPLELLVSNVTQCVCVCSCLFWILVFGFGKFCVFSKMIHIQLSFIGWCSFGDVIKGYDYFDKFASNRFMMMHIHLMFDWNVVFIALHQLIEHNRLHSEFYSIAWN